MNQVMSSWEKEVYFQWGRLHKYIKKALPYLSGEMTEEDLLSGVINGSIHLWPLEDGFILTSEERHERLMNLCVLLVGGENWGTIAEKLEEVKAFGKEKGCKNIVTYSRLGLLRNGAMKKMGFKPERVVFKMEL